MTSAFRRDYKRTSAMLDRLLHRSVVLNIDGDSYRMRSHRARAEATRRAVAAPPPKAATVPGASPTVPSL